MLLIGRLIVGTGIGIANVACSTYVAETGILNWGGHLFDDR